MNMNFFSPMEQFEVLILKGLKLFGNFDFSLTNGVWYILLVGILLVFLLSLSVQRIKLVPTRIQSIMELLYEFIVEMLRKQAGSAAVEYVPLLFLVFIFIAGCNVVGLLPFSFTPTAQLIVTSTLSFSFNIAFLIIGFLIHGVGFLKLFVPAGSPKALLPLLVVIEIFSYSIRPISLSLRLFANMMAGHTLLHILSSFFWTLAVSAVPLIAFFPGVLLVAVFFLELGIAFLQAYVFTILLAIYLNDSLNLH